MLTKSTRYNVDTGRYSLVLHSLGIQVKLPSADTFAANVKLADFLTLVLSMDAFAFQPNGMLETVFDTQGHSNFN